jgi:hypothetical protein
MEAGLHRIALLNEEVALDVPVDQPLDECGEQGGMIAIAIAGAA